ncbi:hypothetical protein CVT26_010772 [Gymnopilus dilepis]|uniref:Uncharacterized protein n=1 Tax=Gymnopilus dilepis TaxID=231916 RepID=A0A409W5A6_9AGAR|nr:hypothetical protein CVT26_010772 [Gymnopilus dilepis]
MDGDAEKKRNEEAYALVAERRRMLPADESCAQREENWAAEGWRTDGNLLRSGKGMGFSRTLHGQSSAEKK